MSRPRKGPALPAPFHKSDQLRFLCAYARVCEATAVKWLAGDQSVTEPYCRQLVLACQSMGIVPPLGAKLPLPIGIEAAQAKPLRVVS
jgi:hypothetical protein